MATGYHHSYPDFGEKILRGPGLTAHVGAIAAAAGAIAVATAPEATGEFKGSFVVGTAIEDHQGLRVVGFLGSTDPDAAAKEFTNPDPAKNHTMNNAMQRAIG
jgi:NADPH-dependent curcumin reductase CurA